MDPSDNEQSNRREFNRRQRRFPRRRGVIRNEDEFDEDILNAMENDAVFDALREAEAEALEEAELLEEGREVEPELGGLPNLFPDRSGIRSFTHENRAISSVIKTRTERVPTDWLVPLDDPTEGEDVNAWYLPMSALVHIFSYLSRDDLDRCELVNRTWRSIVQHHPSKMEKRTFGFVELSSFKEFSIAFYYGRTRRKIAVKKYFYPFDIDGAAKEQVERFKKLKTYRYNCGHIYHSNRSPGDDMARFRRICVPGNFLIYSKSALYAKKIFTPPMEYFDIFKHYMKNGQIKDLVFKNFSLTEFFVEKWVSIFGEYMRVDSLVLHNVSLKHISSETFHRFCGHVLIAKSYQLEHLRNVLPQHISAKLVMTPGFIQCESLRLGTMQGRHRPRLSPMGVMVHLDGDALLNFVKERVKVKAPRGISLKTTCGILNTQSILMDYKLIYFRCTYDERVSLFKLFHIEDAKFEGSDDSDLL